MKIDKNNASSLIIQLVIGLVIVGLLAAIVSLGSGFMKQSQQRDDSVEVYKPAIRVD